MSVLVRVLFVCTGNICRSPLAEALLREKAERAGLQVEAASAGTSNEEAGNPVDPRVREVARRRGVRLPHRIARQVTPADLRDHDLILAMTRVHRRLLERLAPSEATARLELLMTYAPAHGALDVPDPWYGDDAAFEHAHDLIEAGVDGLVAELQAACRARPASGS